MSGPKPLDQAEVEQEIRDLTDAVVSVAKRRVLVATDQTFAAVGEAAADALASGYSLGRRTAAAGLTAFFLDTIARCRDMGGDLDTLEAWVRHLWPDIQKGAQS